MMHVHFDLSQLESAASRWERRSQRIADDVAREIQAAADGYVSEAVTETPERTGNLRGRWVVITTREGVTIRNASRYARFVLGGTLAARVRARIVARIPQLQPGVVRRMTHGG